MHDKGARASNAHALLMSFSISSRYTIFRTTKRHICSCAPGRTVGQKNKRLIQLMGYIGYNNSLDSSCSGKPTHSTSLKPLFLLHMMNLLCGSQILRIGYCAYHTQYTSPVHTVTETTLIELNLQSEESSLSSSSNNCRILQIHNYWLCYSRPTILSFALSHSQQWGQQAPG